MMSQDAKILRRWMVLLWAASMGYLGGIAGHPPIVSAIFAAVVLIIGYVVESIETR